jgi:hypothetical protein
MAEFAQAQGHEQYVALLDLIFLHDNPLIRSIFTWNDIGGLLEDSPRATDWPALIDMVRKYEGAESAALAARWFECQPEGVTVFRDASGVVTGFSCFVTLRPSEQELIAQDPGTAAAWRFVQSQPPLADGQFAVIARFWMDRDVYQAISPTQGMFFVTMIRYVLTTPGLAYSFHIFADADLWVSGADQVLFQRLPDADFSVGERRYGAYLRDWRAQSPQAWLEALAERETA